MCVSRKSHKQRQRQRHGRDEVETMRQVKGGRAVSGSKNNPAGRRDIAVTSIYSNKQQKRRERERAEVESVTKASDEQLIQ